VAEQPVQYSYCQATKSRSNKSEIVLVFETLMLLRVIKKYSLGLPKNGLGKAVANGLEAEVS
jgi:hypothetical protein